MKRIDNYEIDGKTARAIVKVTGSIKTDELWNKYNLTKEEISLLSEFYDLVDKEES